MSHDDDRYVRAFIVGGTSVGIFSGLMDWCFRNWKLLFCLWVVSSIYGYIHDHLFSPMTKDLSSEIKEQYKNVKVAGVSFTYGRNDHPFDSDYYLDKHVWTITATIQNDTKARITDLWVRCDGQTVTQPPDHDYAPEVEDTHQTFHLAALTIPAGATVTMPIAINGTPEIRSNKGKLSCTISSASFVDKDFYIAQGEVDKYGLGQLSDTITGTVGGKPTTYGGSSYPIYIGGTVTNISKTQIKGFRVNCHYVSDGGAKMDEFARFDNINLTPGQTYTLHGKVEATYSHPTAAQCALYDLID